MKERLVDDWLTRINERGYQTAFGQVLAAQGFNILRIGHSAYEHGKDVLAIAPNGEAHCYQLKDGDIDIDTFERYFGQISALIQARPSHPSLPAEYIYRAFLVTNGSFTDPVLDRILHHNLGWEKIGFPRLEVHDDRWLHRHFTDLALDFWPTSPPDVRQFRRFYLVDGRGDFDPGTFAQFVRLLLPDNLSRRDLERHAAAVNIFVSYILGEFYRQNDHWSIFGAWTMTAAAIATFAWVVVIRFNKTRPRPVPPAAASALPVTLAASAAGAVLIAWLESSVARVAALSVMPRRAK